MASDVTRKASPGTLWKPPPREKKPSAGLNRSTVPMRQTEMPRPTQPINQRGKAAKGRTADKAKLMKAQPASHEGLHHCYIGNHWVERVDLEHVIDASLRPDLARDPRNHKKACNPHNIAKKDGRLTEAEEIRVQNAIEEVLNEQG